MAVLGPFNFPGHLPNGHIVPALIAGDTVVFKPSRGDAAGGRADGPRWEAAGLPARRAQPRAGRARHGRRAAGAATSTACCSPARPGAGRHFRRAFVDRPEVILALELGGDNPLVVWDAADPAAAAAIVVQSAFVTTGQRCSCARRLILPRGPAGDAVVEATVALADRLRDRAAGTTRTSPSWVR